MLLKAKSKFTYVCWGLLALSATSCGKHTKVESSTRSTSKSVNAYRQSIATDSSMRQLVNPKWSCGQSATTAQNESYLYRWVTIFNRADMHTLQLSVYSSDQKVPTMDYLLVEGLECFYSSSESRVVKCVSKSDPSLKIESQVSLLNDPQEDVLTLTVTGQESSFRVYFGGRDNRFVTLSEFKKRHRHPFTFRVHSPDQCGFEN